MPRRLVQPTKSSPAAPTGKADREPKAAPLPEQLRPFTAPEGASPFTAALTGATPEDLRRVQDVIGRVTPETLVLWHQRTKNPVWLWISLACCDSPKDMPPEVFEYLRSAAAKLLDAFVQQICSLENFRIMPSEQTGEAGQEQDHGSRSRVPRTHPCLPDILEFLGFRQPGRNPIQAAAHEMRDISFYVAEESIVREKDLRRHAIRARLAKDVGRDYGDIKAGDASIKQFTTRGKKLAAGTRAKRGK